MYADEVEMATVCFAVGASAALMQAPVANLTEADMVAIAAYTASLPQ
jgi:cytochrome c553